MIKLYITFFMLVALSVCTGTVNAQVCKTDSIPATTPTSQFADNGDGTVTDRKTKLMWTKCFGFKSGANCENDIVIPPSFEAASIFDAIQKINNYNGFAGGYNDWRIPNFKELNSIVERQCFSPSINMTVFSGVSSEHVILFSSSPMFSGSSLRYFLLENGVQFGYLAENLLGDLLEDGADFSVLGNVLLLVRDAPPLPEY